MLEKAEKGQGLALKLFNSGRVKYQQHVKHTHRGIGILPSLIVKYWTNGFYKIVKPLYLVRHIVARPYILRTCSGAIGGRPVLADLPSDSQISDYLSIFKDC